MENSIEISPEQLDEILKDRYFHNMAHQLEMAIKLKFPNIKSLCVTRKNVSFEAGEYTKEQMEAFINSLKSTE